MAKLNNPVEIMKLLDKSNCRECGCRTCLAFATDVYHGRKKLKDCPKLDEDTLAEYAGEVAGKEPFNRRTEEVMEELKKMIASLDLEAAAKRIGAPYADGRLTLRVLGKNVGVDAAGNIFTQIHVNTWIAGPVFDYIANGDGAEPSGRWVHFRDLPGGRTRQPLFGQRCEKPCKRLADANPDFFDVLIKLFSGKKIKAEYESDVSLVLLPLPKFPLLICYWKPDGAMPSELNIFFDADAERNLSAASIFGLATGLVAMFEKVSLRHCGDAAT